MTQSSVASNIIDQLTHSPGGRGMNRLRAMVGASDFGYGEDTVRFRFKGCRKWSVCQIKLNDDDLYDLTFAAMLGRKINHREINGIDVEGLPRVFREITGLATNL